MWLHTGPNHVSQCRANQTTESWRQLQGPHIPKASGLALLGNPEKQVHSQARSGGQGRIAHRHGQQGLPQQLRVAAGWLADR